MWHYQNNYSILFLDIINTSINFGILFNFIKLWSMLHKKMGILFLLSSFFMSLLSWEKEMLTSFLRQYFNVWYVFDNCHLCFWCNILAVTFVRLQVYVTANILYSFLYIFFNFVSQESVQNLQTIGSTQGSNW